MMRIPVLLCCTVVLAPAQTVTVSLYGFIDPTSLSATDNAHLLSGDASALSRIHYGTVALPLPASLSADQQASILSVLSGCVVCRGTLTPALAWNPAQRAYLVSAFTVEGVYADVYSLGTCATTQLMTGPVPLGAVGSSQVLTAYRIEDGTVSWYPLVEGATLPSALAAATLRWNSCAWNRPGTVAGGSLMVGDAQWMSVGAASACEPLSDFTGAWVQFRDQANGSYYYLLESELQYLDPAQFDPVACNGQLLANGRCSQVPTQPAGIMSGAYAVPGGALSIPVTFALASAHGLTSLPATLQARADEQPPPVGDTATVTIDTTAQYAQLATISSAGATTGTVQFFAPGALREQSTAGVHALAIAPPDPTIPAVLQPVTGPGASGWSQSQAMALAQPPTASQADITREGTGITLDYGPDPVTGAPRTASISSTATLRAMDDALNADLACTMDPGGNLRGPQQTPVVIRIGTSLTAQDLAGRPDDTITAMDRANALLAPHLPGFTQWQAPDRKLHHGALIYPVDLYEGSLLAKYAAETGISRGDREGDPVPGDGDNPVHPLPAPNAPLAGHPFYDVDDDGDLDRWATDDPFAGGYRRIRIQWRVEAGTKQLGEFAYSFANQVVVSGFKPPRRDPGTGRYALSEDLLFSMSHNFKPYSHRVLRVTYKSITYLTYYGGGLLTMLDPYDPGDPSIYQLALRNCAVTGLPDADSDGVTPAELVFKVRSSYQQVPYDINHDGRLDPGEVAFHQVTVYWYPNLPASLFDATAIWGWCSSGGSPVPYALPSDIVLPARVPAVVNDQYALGDGTVLASSQYALPYWPAAGGGYVPFAPGSLPVAQPPPPGSITASSDGYMWDYPQGAPTAQGGTLPANPQAWQFPWNLAWNGDARSTYHSTKTFTLNSANLSYFPSEYATMMPVITHDGLVADAQRAGQAPSVRWLLRELQAPDPMGGYTQDQWRDGVALFQQTGWVPGSEWMLAGRSPLHVASWDARSDMSGPGRDVGSITMSTGSRCYEVLAGLGEYTFLGQTYRPVTVDQQVELINRMWAYYFSGDLRHFQDPSRWILPSICIPQRFDNASLTSRALNTAFVPVTMAPPVIGDPADASHAGALNGDLVNGLAQATSSPDTAFRAATQRRIKLMGEQEFLFSASRGREWELAMARHMPDSVRLICLEWDDKAFVQRILAGRHVVFPETSVQVITDSMGVAKTISLSNERELLKELSRDWFDGWQTRMGYANGAFGADGGAFASAAMDPVAQQINQSPTGFIRMDPGNQPMGFASYAYELGTIPQDAARTWAPEAGSSAISAYPIQFRHPMLILYHDRASSIYVHYGRNCDPDEVFGNWDRCAPATGLTAISVERARRMRFSAWQDQPRLEGVYDQLHPALYAAFLATRQDEPPGPPSPGSEPQPPATVPPPGIPPSLPQAVPPPVWTRPHRSWGDTGGSCQADLTRLPDWATSYPDAIQVDASIDAVIDAWVGQMAWALNPGFLQFEDGWSPWYAGGLFPGNHLWEEGLSSWDGGHDIVGYLAPRDGVSTYRVTFYRSGWDSGAVHPFSVSDAVTGVPLLSFYGQGWQMQTIAIPPGGVRIRWNQWDYDAYVITFIYAIADASGNPIAGCGNWAFPDGDSSLEGICWNLGDIYDAFTQQPVAKLERQDYVVDPQLHAMSFFHADGSQDNEYHYDVYLSTGAYFERLTVADPGISASECMTEAGFNWDGSRWYAMTVHVYASMVRWNHYWIDCARTGVLDMGNDFFFWGGQPDYYSFISCLSNPYLQTYTGYSNCPEARSIALRDKAAWTGYQAALAAYAIANSRFDGGLAAYRDYLAQVAAYGESHATWVAAQAAYQAWYDQQAAYLALKAQGDRFASDRASWVLLVQAEAGKPAGSWSGDTLVQCATAEQLAAIQPRLPIWEAYLYAIDPTHPVAQVSN